MKKSTPKKQLREFGLLFGIGIVVLIGWLLPTILGHSFREWTLWFGVPVLILGFIAPHLLHYPYRIWMNLGHILGMINSYIILSLIFIFVLQPIACFMRIFGHDPLRKQKKDGATNKEDRQNHRVDLTRIF